MQSPPPQGVRVASERMVLNTDAGFIVIALFPDVAPKHVEQLLKLTRLGLYDGTWFHRAQKNFVLQINNVEFHRTKRLTPQQQEAVHPLPLEPSKLRYERGTVSMAHHDDDPNGGTTSFSIHLSPAPHMTDDKTGLTKYTIFGFVEYGMDVVDELMKVPVRGSDPRMRLTVHQTQLVTGVELAKNPPQSARPLNIPPELTNEMIATPELQRMYLERQIFFILGIILMIAFALLGVFGSKWSPKQIQSFNLMTVLVGCFLLFGLLIPIGHDMITQADPTDWSRFIVPTLVFFGLLGLFRLMSRFESAA